MMTNNLLEYRDLPKADKRIVQELLELGAKRMRREGLEKAEAVINRWRQFRVNDESDDAAYMELYETVTRHDKLIARTFDGLSGSHFVTTVSGLFVDGVINDEDLQGLTPETCNYFHRYKNTIESISHKD